MGKRQVRIIVVRKSATAVLLLLLSAAMAAMVHYLSGKAYAPESDVVLGVLERLISPHQPAPSRAVLLAAVMPLVANVLLFIPWGFLFFVWVDTPRRSRFFSYAATFLCGLLFAAAMEFWQFFLPTRVTNPADVMANALGALAGGIGGHLRKQVRVQFEY